MIQLQMKGGAVFAPEEVEIEIRVRRGESLQVYGWADIDRIVCLDGEYGVTDARFGVGNETMPVRSLTWTDTSDLRVDIPMPLEAARGLAEVLGSSKVEIVKSLPPGLMFQRPPGA